MAKSPLLWFLAVSAIACAAHSQEASTKPVGFQTVTLKGSNYNLIGVNFLRPVITSGALESANGTSVTDDQGNFTNTLPAGASYWLELIDGPNQGSWSIVSPSNATALNTVTDLASYVTAGVKYEIRSAPTLADLFGATNAKGLKAGTSLTADLIWIPNDEGGFDKAFYAAATPPFLTAGWRMIGSGNADMSQVPVYHIEGLIIERRGTTDLEVYFDGAVKMTSSVIPVTSGFNYVQRSFPIGTTLGNSGLTSQVQVATTSTSWRQRTRPT